MIPDYLKGKSAAQIVREVRRNFAYDNDKQVAIIDEEYIIYLEELLLLAVRDSLCNVDETPDMNVAGRAIAFLNMVLPYKEA